LKAKLATDHERVASDAELYSSMVRREEADIELNKGLSANDLMEKAHAVFARVCASIAEMVFRAAAEIA